MRSGNNGVSVIVASARPPAMVRECVTAVLTSLAGLSPVELIIVRDTPRVTDPRRWLPPHTGIPVKVLHTEQRRGSAYARQLGVEAASYETLLFTDDDTLVPPEWASKMADAVLRHQVVTGPIRSRTSGFWERCDEAIDIYRVNARDRHGAVKFLSFPNLGITRSMFATAPLDTSRANRVEDIELACRLRLAGVRPHLVDSPVVSALYPDSFASFTRRKIRHGLGMGRLRAKLGRQAWQQLDLGRTGELFQRWIRLSRDVAAQAGPLRRAQVTAANLAYCCAFLITSTAPARPRRAGETSR